MLELKEIATVKLSDAAPAARTAPGAVGVNAGERELQTQGAAKSRASACPTVACTHAMSCMLLPSPQARKPAAGCELMSEPVPPLLQVTRTVRARGMAPDPDQREMSRDAGPLPLGRIATWRGALGEDGNRGRRLVSFATADGSPSPWP
jgi:hypothetical protein